MILDCPKRWISLGVENRLFFRGQTQKAGGVDVRHGDSLLVKRSVQYKVCHRSVGLGEAPFAEYATMYCTVL